MYIGKIAVINGPNMNMLGVREPDIYGNEKWDSIEIRLKKLAIELNVEILFYQSNIEGQLVNYIQKTINDVQGYVINPAAYTKTGYAILEALTIVDKPFIEVHMSNIYSRGEWHADSIFSGKAVGQIIGFRSYVYDLGLMAMVDYIKTNRRKKNNYKRSE